MHTIVPYRLSYHPLETRNPLQTENEGGKKRPLQKYFSYNSTIDNCNSGHTNYLS